MRDCGCHSHNGFLLSPEGLAQREMFSEGDLTRLDDCVSLDMVGSVSALDEPSEPIWVDQVIEEQLLRSLS